MGTQKLGLGPDSSFDTDDAGRRLDDARWKARNDYVSELMDRWFASRWEWTTVPVGLSVLCFLFDWGGFRGKFIPWGDPRTLSEIWWHFPVIVAVLTAGFGIDEWVRGYVHDRTCDRD